ncbi:MAG: AprI/Inh family metalloprotease inhibitor [Hyphomonadaceae bacterium]|nr:AprI/Inh family metalloprotease inhibitor [Hyphomonadaceae bacterium]
MRRVVIGAVAMLAAGCSPPASTSEAQTNEAAERPHQAGVYVFDSEPGALVACIMKLDDNTVADAPGFHSVWLGPGCETNFPVLSALTGWEEMENGGVRLIAAEGSTFGEFARGEDGLLRATSQNDGRTYTMMMGE